MLSSLSGSVMGRLLGSLSVLEASLLVDTSFPISHREKWKLRKECSVFKVVRPESSGPESWAQAA